MNKTIITILFICIIGAFVFFTNSIIDIYMFQLRMKIDREQVHNYELSSRMLRNRFKNLKGKKENYQDEIRMSVLESGIMNESIDANYFSPNISEFIGYFVANSVRFIVMRPFLQINEDRQLLFLMQYAFYMERQKRYQSASAKYKDIETILKNKKDTDRAFVLLHNSYCLALMGETDESLKRLEEVIRLFPGTHYQETALLLRSLLLGFKDKNIDIEKNISNSSDRIALYFEEGLYKSVINETENIEKSDSQNQYYRARSLEETGEIPGAMNIYVDIISKGKEKDVAKKANRRLLIIGSFYGGGEKVKEYAVANAVDFKEEMFLSEVKKAEDLKLSSSVVSKINEVKKENGDSSNTAIATVIQDFEINYSAEENKLIKVYEKIDIKGTGKTNISDKDRTDAVKNQVKNESENKVENIVPDKKEIPRDEVNKSDAISKNKLPDSQLYYLRVYLKDGRSIRGEGVKVSDKKLLVKNGSFFITLALLDVVRIAGEGKNNIKFMIQDGEASHTIISRELILNGDEFNLKESNKFFQRESLVSGMASK